MACIVKCHSTYRPCLRSRCFRLPSRAASCCWHGYRIALQQPWPSGAQPFLTAAAATALIAARGPYSRYLVDCGGKRCVGRCLRHHVVRCAQLRGAPNTALSCSSRSWDLARRVYIPTLLRNACRSRSPDGSDRRQLHAPLRIRAVEGAKGEAGLPLAHYCSAGRARRRYPSSHSARRLAVWH